MVQGTVMVKETPFTNMQSHQVDKAEKNSDYHMKLIEVILEEARTHFVF